MLKSYFSSPGRSKVIKTTVFIRCFRSGDRGRYFCIKNAFWHKIIILVKICTFWCQGPVEVPRSDRRCFWTRKTNGLRQPQMLGFRDFSVPATLFLIFSENGTSLSQKCIQNPSFGPARPQRAKHCITNAFLYTFRGVWRHRADFHKKGIFSGKSKLQQGYLVCTKSWILQYIYCFCWNRSLAQTPIIPRGYQWFGGMWPRNSAKIIELIEFYEFYDIFMNFWKIKGFMIFVKIMGSHENIQPSVPGHVKPTGFYTILGFW